MESKAVIVAGTLILAPRSLFRRQVPCRIASSASISGASRSFYSPAKSVNGSVRVVRRFCVSALVSDSTPAICFGGICVERCSVVEQKHKVECYLYTGCGAERTLLLVDLALETLVESRISGFPVVDDDGKLVGLVSDYDLLALDIISELQYCSVAQTLGFGLQTSNVYPYKAVPDGNGLQLSDGSLFPEVDSNWKVFNELQRSLGKTSGRLVADVMTPVPVVVREKTNLEDAARLLLETRFRRLPVVDADGKLVGILTRGNVIRAALEIKSDGEEGAHQ
ncbi:hypothetical protein Cgig2_025429 [Carnegiea gigantea]|uniref:CBS domain-containing protein n=1 Tax=Carnegiea gigantea TaxID=171969 RepID=A0A9Q1QAG9_9CARY|nr:hypothetical protein Cgig2_025429 [Carnegiea gigantea]